MKAEGCGEEALVRQLNRVDEDESGDAPRTALPMKGELVEAEVTALLTAVLL